MTREFQVGETYFNDTATGDEFQAGESYFNEEAAAGGAFDPANGFPYMVYPNRHMEKVLVVPY